MIDPLTRMTLREAVEADLPALAEVHQRAFHPGWNADELADVGSGPGVFGLLAEEAGAIIGMILCRTVADEAEILTVAVDPDLRRGGVGRALVAGAVGLAKQRGALDVFLEVAIDNHGALRLYDQAGFAQAGLRRGYYDRGGGLRIDAVVMRLDLRPL
jgi:ribosomal-protein-alanine N-acetyltransferase